LKTDEIANRLNPRALSKTLKELGFVTKQTRINSEKSIKKVIFSNELIETLFKKYGFDVSIVSIVADGMPCAQNALNVKNGSPTYNRNNRNNETELFNKILQEFKQNIPIFLDDVKNLRSG
jgi:hypothetical protein